MSCCGFDSAWTSTKSMSKVTLSETFQLPQFLAALIKDFDL
jgi:hypothetical protein